jgi:hypothetical protein
MPDETVVRSSDRLWSEEVAIADAEHPLPLNPVVYEFAGGRRLFIDKDNPYA